MNKEEIKNISKLANLICENQGDVITIKSYYFNEVISSLSNYSIIDINDLTNNEIDFLLEKKLECKKLNSKKVIVSKFKDILTYDEEDIIEIKKLESKGLKVKKWETPIIIVGLILFLILLNYLNYNFSLINLLIFVLSFGSGFLVNIYLKNRLNKQQQKTYKEIL